MSHPHSGLLVDTGFFFALYDERDNRHGDAMEKQDTLLVDDSSYRNRAYGLALASSQRGEPVSLVDVILQAIIGDVNIPIAAMLTFNRRDFAAVCARHSVELL